MPQKSLVPVVSLVPTDNPDWDHARNKRLALRVPEAEWSQSTLTALHADGFYAPQNDFSYEGLLCLAHRETWKFLDRLGFQVQQGGAAVEFTATSVEASPERVLYRYRGAPGELEVSYALLALPEGGSVMMVGFKLKSSAKDLTLVLKPVLDIRHMYHPSDPGRHRVKRAEPHHVTFVAQQRWFAIGSPTAFTFAPRREAIELSYGLGHGEREGADGQVCFKRETHSGYVPGELTMPLVGEAQIFMAAGEAEAEAVGRIQAAQKSHTAWLAAQEKRLVDYFKRFPRLSAEAVYRLYVMSEKFGVPVEGVLVPESGGWWFRTPWFRNVFEGFLHNQATLRQLGKGTMIEDAIRLALKYQEPGTGRLPNRIPELAADLERWEKTGSLPADYYEASDAIPLLFTLLEGHLPHIEDAALVEACWVGFKLAFKAFKASRLNLRHGNPVLVENGLLASVPSHSWMNGKRVVWAEGITVTDLPIRVPLNWQIQDVLSFRDSHYTWEQYQYPNYYLPEVNAQWLRMLAVGITLAVRFEDADLADELRQVRQLGIEAFKGIFWNPHTKGLYNVVTLDRRIDGTPSASGIEAAALLGSEVFSEAELEQIWQLAKNRLLVNRQGDGKQLAFGLLAKDSPERVFYDNQQYHEAVVWPRETPYLIRLLRQLGHSEVVAELLESNLAHQMDEAVLFYNNEMLSLAEGHNPSPQAETRHNPVPVKNQMQWWSQWCDPYLGE